MQYLTKLVKLAVPYGTDFKEKINVLLIAGLIIGLFFPIRKIFITDLSNILRIYSDFTTFSLYGVDIIVAALIGYNYKIFYSIKWRSLLVTGLILFAYLVTWNFLLTENSSKQLFYYYLVRFVELLLLYFVITRIKIHVTFVLTTISILGAVNAIITIIQFSLQKSLGLKILGESFLNNSIQGVAKIVLYGTEYIRGYGTLPHPNVLSAFLFTATLISFFLLIYSNNQNKRIIYSLTMILNLIGLFLSFSRAGIFTTLLFTVILALTILITNREKWKHLIYSSSIYIITVVSIGIAIAPFLFTRVTINDQAVLERKFYNNIGLQIVKQFPVSGVGFGQSLLHMQQFSFSKLEPWQVQPIHNYFLLLAAEGGLVLLFIFTTFVFYHLYKLIRITVNRYRNKDAGQFHVLLLSLLLGYLFLMLFDHYFYTLVPAQMLFWLILGLAMNEIKKAAL